MPPRTPSRIPAVVPAGLLEALSLLTRVPVPAGGTGPADGCRWYPVVGALLGGVVGLVLLGSAAVLPVTVAAVLAVAVEVALTGALHLDGLADCADGTAGRDPAHRLRIMRDHAVGVYGTVAVVLDLALRVGCLTALATAAQRDLGAPAVLGAVVAVWSLSRAAVLLPAQVLPYAREDGTGRAVVEGLTRRQGVLGTAVGAVLALLSGLLGGAAGVVAVLVALAAVAVVAALVVRWARARLGGATGDVLGAVVELGGLAGLVAVVAVLG